MRSTPALEVLSRRGIVHRVHRYTSDPSIGSYGREAAEALAVEPERIFKTLVATAGDGLVVAVVPVLFELDLKALAGVVGAKRAALADPAAAERATGYVLGGISPVGLKRTRPTVVDSSAAAWDTIFVSGGRRGLELELRADDLLDLTGGRLAPIARPGARRPPET